jgi:hypothetical protein
MKPGDFPIGSPESRAAARAILIKQGEEDGEFDATHVVIWTGLPVAKGEPIVVAPPDTLACYKMSDGSFVQVVRRHWTSEGRSGVTAFIHQTSQDGRAYSGSCEVKGLLELKRFGRRCAEPCYV